MNIAADVSEDLLSWKAGPPRAIRQCIRCCYVCLIQRRSDPRRIGERGTGSCCGFEPLRIGHEGLRVCQRANGAWDLRVPSIYSALGFAQELRASDPPRPVPSLLVEARVDVRYASLVGIQGAACQRIRIDQQVFNLVDVEAVYSLILSQRRPAVPICLAKIPIDEPEYMLQP